MSTLRVVSVTLGLVGCLVACSTKPVNITEQGTISSTDEVHPTDGSNYDEYTFSAKAGWDIDIMMSSTEIDSFLQLRRPGISDDTWLEEADDISADNRNAHLTITAPASGKYVLWANTAGSGDTGAYTLTIRAEPPK